MMQGPTPPTQNRVITGIPDGSSSQQRLTSDKQSTRKSKDTPGGGSEISGVAQNLQMFLQVVQEGGTSMFDQVDQMPRQPPTVSRRRESLQDQECVEEKMIVHFPYKRAQSTLDLVQSNPSCPSERSNSKKQVRFDIRESLKEIMAQVENDENNSALSNQVPVYQPVAKLKLPQTKRVVQDQRSRSKSLESSKSPQQRRQTSSESGHSLKPPKLGQFKTRQLALKYKLNAEEMRRKKFGIEQQPLVQEESTYSTIVSGAGPNDDSRETPNFSVIHSKRDLNEDDCFHDIPDLTEEPPMPSELNPPEMLQIPTSLDVYEEINHPHHIRVYSPVNREKSMGMIVRNQAIIQSQVFTYQSSNVQTQRENSQNSSRLSNYQAGVIVRQRSQSPNVGTAAGFQFQNHSKRQSEPPQVGQIVRNSSQSQLLATQSMPNILLHQRLATSPASSQIQMLKNHGRLVTQETQVTEGPVAITASSLQNSIAERFKTHVHGTIWDMLNLNPADCKRQLMQLQSSSQGLRHQLLQVLISSQMSPDFKLARLRAYLPKLVMSSLIDEVEQVTYLRERRDQRLTDLKRVLKAMKKAGHSQHDQLKGELLRDIVDRLNQKLALMVLKINARVKREMYLQFEMYYVDYIARDYLTKTIRQFKAYLGETEHKRQYIAQVKFTLQAIHLKYMFQSWRSIKPHRESRQRLLQERQEQFSLLRSQKLLTLWLRSAKSKKLKASHMDLVALFRERKLLHELFLRWSTAILQHSKIKRRALHRLTKGGGFGEHTDGKLLEDEDQRLHLALKRVEIGFKRHVRAWVNRVRDLKGQMLIQSHDGANRRKAHQQHGSAQSVGSRVIQQVEVRPGQMFDEVDMRRTSMDVGIKYNIHQALVMQQNAQRLRAQSAQRDTMQQKLNQRQQGTTHRRGISFISDGEQFRPSSTDRTQYQPVIHNVFLQNYKINQNRIQDQQKPRSKSLFPASHSGEPLIDRVKSEVFSKANHKHSLESLPYHHHFVVSLRANAHDIVNKEAFTGFTDYIQYGLASRVNKLVFQRMFKTKVLSVLFTQWRKRFMHKRLKSSMSHIHTVHLGKQSLVEWHRTLQQRKLWVKDFQRTKHVERFYNLFRRWAQMNRQIRYDDERAVRGFKRRVIFNGWLRHLQKRGDQLVGILKAQNYHGQTLLTKSLLSLYQNYLQGLRVRQFQRFHCFRKYFIKTWMRKHQKLTKLRSILSKLGKKESVLEREKYVREFEVKRYVLQNWFEQAKEKRVEIKCIAAETHYRQGLVIKTFFHIKKVWRIAEGAKRLSQLLKDRAYRPALQSIAANSCGLKSSEMRFKTYQTQVGLARIFMGWKEYSIQMKLSRLFFKKLVLKHLYTYVMTKNHLLPKHYRIRRLQALFLKTLTDQVKAKWNEKRSEIILRQLYQKRRERLLKVSFLKLLENVLKGKQERLVSATVWDFRRGILCQKAYRVMKRRWLKKKKQGLMKRVAADFSSQRDYRKMDQLRESVLSHTNDYEMVRLRELKIFEDPYKMLKYHALAAWKMYIQEKIRRDTVLDRFLLFKRRMLSLRCFLGWRSVAKYEQSSGYATSAAQHSRALSSSSRQEALSFKAPTVAQIPSTREQSSGTKRDSSSRVRSVTHRDKPNVRFAETRSFLFEPQANMMSGTSSSNHDHQYSGAASATFGMRSIASNYDSNKIPPSILDETPRDCQLRSTQFLKEQSQGSGKAPLQSSLFDELEGIFQKNRKWLDEQREREDFLREMASHYNQRLSQEMNTIRHSQEDANRYPSLMTISLSSRR